MLITETSIICSTRPLTHENHHRKYKLNKSQRVVEVIDKTRF